jgi:L-threonylcarbamoyladenylate synthase
MQRLAVDPEHPDAATMIRAAGVLARGGVVAYPTDTLYGLAVDPRNDRAVERLFQAKERAAGVAVPLIAGSIDQAFAVASFSGAEERLARAFWPGPLSILLPAASVISHRVRGGDGTVAVRVPAHAVARALPLAFGCAVTATSANRSGAAPAATAQEAGTMADVIDALVDAGPAPGGPPSTIVQLTDQGPRLLRAGAIAWDRVLTFLR